MGSFDYDYVLSDSSDDDDAEILIVEEEITSDVIVFDDEMSVNEKMLHLLNLLSKGHDINKYAQFWANKTRKLLNLAKRSDRSPNISNLHSSNPNMVPAVDIVRKITEIEPTESFAARYEYEDYCKKESLLEYLTTMHAISGSVFGDYSEKKKYIELAPHVFNPDSTFTVDRDTDVYFNGHFLRMLATRTDLLAPADRHALVGFMNRSCESSKVVHFDVDKYLSHIQELEEGSDVYVCANQFATARAATVSRVHANGDLVLQMGSTTLLYHVDQIYKNKFYIYATTVPKQDMIRKKDLLTSNILFKLAPIQIRTQQQLDVIALTGDDMLSILRSDPLYKESVPSFEMLRSRHPGILETTFDNSSWSTFYEKLKTRKRPAAERVSIRDHEMQDKFRRLYSENKDDIAFLNSVRALKSVETKGAKTPKKIHSSRKQTPKTKADTLVFSFYSVQQSLEHKISRYDPSARAYLTCASLYYRHGKNIYPHNYMVFKMKHVNQDDGSVKWDIKGQAKLPHETPALDTQYEYTSVDIDYYIANAELQNSVHHDCIPRNTQYITNKAYSMYQGKTDFDDSFVIEFGVSMDAMPIDTNEIDTDAMMDRLSSGPKAFIVHRLAAHAGVTLTNAQIAFITRSVPSARFDVKSTEAITEAYRMVVICFAFFVVFSQCQLPKVIVSRVAQQDVFSFPINPKSNKLVEHMANVISSKVANDPDFSMVMGHRTIAAQQNKENILMTVIKSLLKQSQKIKVQLDNAHYKYTSSKYGNVNVNVTAANTDADAHADAFASTTWSVYRPLPEDKKTTKQNPMVKFLRNLDAYTEPLQVSKTLDFYSEWRKPGKPGATAEVVNLIGKTPFTTITQLAKPASVNMFGIDAIRQPAKRMFTTANKDWCSESSLEQLLGNIYNSNDYYKNNLMLSQVYNSFKDPQGWNALSLFLEKVQKSNKDNLVGQMVDGVLNGASNASNASADVLTKFTCINLKDLLGKMQYKFKTKSETQVITHRTALTRYLQMTNVALDERVVWILKTLCNWNYALVSASEARDAKFVMLYIIVLIIWHLQNPELDVSEFKKSAEFGESVITNYICKEIMAKLQFNTMNVDDARARFEIERERGKQEQMKAYKNMEGDVRRLNKRLVETGLLTKENMMIKYGEVDAEEATDRINQEKEDFDMNEDHE